MTGIAGKREETRSQVAKMLLWFAFISILAFLVVGGILMCKLPPERFDFKDMLNLFLAMTTFWSGVLGGLVAFYFIAKE